MGGMKTKKKKVSAARPAKISAAMRKLMASARAADGWVHHESAKRWSGNPRDNARAVPKVVESIRRFGFVAPLVIWPEGDRLVAGDTRVQSVRRILEEEPGIVLKGSPGPGMVRVVFHSFESEAEAVAYAIADNRLGELAAWRDDMLGPYLLGLPPDLQSAAGYSPEEAASFGPPPEVGPPPEFHSYDLNIKTEHKCPKCGYEWSGEASKSGTAAGPARSRRITSPS